MENKKQYQCILNQNDIKIIENLLNQFPLGRVTVEDAARSNNHAQSILDFLGSKAQEVIHEPKIEENGEN